MDRLDRMFDAGGRLLSPADREFAATLTKELEQFQYQAPKDRALMFRPLGGFQRYLIHKVTQSYPKLTSFSIGDENNRRTVVCFKTKRKDQPVLQPREEAALANEYVNSPQRSYESERGRRSTPLARSRESSRNRKKNDSQPPQSYRGPEPSTHVPKPLRPKKTKRDQMKKSRSLQSSPLLDEESRSLDARRGRSWSHNGKQQQRSSSLKPSRTSRNKSHVVSPNYSEDERKLRKPRLNVSEHSVKKRSQGLRMEGRVINGDIEDPYSCRDSESEARVDADAVRKHKNHHRRSRHRDETSPESESSEEATDSDLEVPSHHDNDVSTESSASTDERPPSCDSLRRSVSIKKAERNLKRIKQADSRHTRALSEGSNHSESDGGSERRSKRSVSSSRPHSLVKQKSATLPKSMKENGEKERSVSKRSNTVKATSSRKKLSGDKKHSKDGSESVKKESRSSAKNHVTEVDAVKKASRDSLDDLVSHSNHELFHPLPDKKNPDVVIGDSSLSGKMQCDGGTQTEVSGTLPRTKAAGDAPQNEPNMPSSQAKSMGELLAAMMQALGLHSQGNPSQSTPNSNPNMNAFYQHLNPNPPPSFPPLPPQLVHHLHMSWLGAYYAGATGVWPPPPPPSFIMSSTSNPHQNTYDFVPPQFTSFSKGSDQEIDKRSDKKPDPRYDSMYTSQLPESYQTQLSDPEEIESACGDIGGAGEGSDLQPSSSHSVNSYEVGRESLSRSDSDVSSVLSRKSEITMTTNPKGGEVIVYMHSRPNSRASSVGATPHDESHNTITADTSSKMFDSKKGKHRPSSLKKRHKSNRDKLGETTPASVNNSSSHVTVSADVKSSPASDKRDRSVSSQSGSGQHGEDEEDCAADASQEEMILSLRRAPLATIEDDELLSTSVASSSSSLHVPESKSSSEHLSNDDEKESVSLSSSTLLHATDNTALVSEPVEASTLPSPNADAHAPLTPPIDHSDENEASDEESPSVPLPHNGTASSDASSISDGNRGGEPSDSSYDADQSRAEDSTQAKHAGKEGEDWQSDEYKRFVEIYNFPASLSDIEISRYLTKYRGLRLSRVDKTIALCTLPTPEGADELLKEHFPIFSTRSLKKATEKSRRKARSKLRGSASKDLATGTN